MKLFRLLVALTAVLFATTTMADIVIVGTVTEASNAFGPNLDGIVGDASLSVDPPGTFDRDFSALGEQAVSITWQAPAGQLIEVDVPTGFPFFNTLTFRFDITGAISNGSGVLNSALSPSLIDPSGDTLPVSLTVFSLSDPTDTGGVFIVSYELTPGATYRFAGLTATGTIPAGYGTVFNDVVIQSFGIFGEVVTDDPNTTPPGQWVRLVPVPEPSSLTLLGLGGLIAARRRRS